MALAGRWTGILTSALIAWMLIVAGCETRRAEAPAPKSEPVGSVPARASSECVEGVPPSNRGQDARDTTLRGVTTSETAPEVKKVQGEMDKTEPVGPAVELALKFVPGQAATYRLTTEYYKSIEWKGSMAGKPAQFTDGRTGNHVEFTFEQRVQQVQDDGSAVLEITIKGLKCVTEAVNKTVFDFDSARPQDANRPLAALIGKSYRVKMSPKGQVVEIANVEPVRQAAAGSLPDQNIAARLLSDDEIRNRHEIAALSALKDRAVRPGQTWSSLKTFSFDDLGAKTYERVYTLKRVGSSQLSVPSSQVSTANRELPTDNSEGRQAIVEMKAIPAAGAAEGSRGRPTANPFAKLSDNIDNYEGRLVLDLDSGQVREDAEQMQNEWIIADPTSIEKGQPVAIRMAARRLHRLERVPPKGGNPKSEFRNSKQTQRANDRNGSAP